MNLNQEISRIQEKRISRNLNKVAEKARVQAGSGNKWYQKSDVVSDRLQIEAKTKVKACKQMVVKKEWFDKISEEALHSNKIPVVVISFGDGRDIFCLSDVDFYSLIKEGD